MKKLVFGAVKNLLLIKSVIVIIEKVKNIVAVEYVVENTVRINENYMKIKNFAEMVELVDTFGLSPNGEIHESSSLSFCTIQML